jgi:hypothetical protein
MPDADALEREVVRALRWHLAGLRAKIAADFADASCENELSALKGDPVYSLFAFDCDEYVLIRMMGRISIAIGRRLGEIYDKIPRVLAAARYGLTANDVAAKFDGLEMDVCLRLAQLNGNEDRRHVQKVAKSFIPAARVRNGLAIEIRYNFNPNDSSRLRKDVHLGELVAAAGLTPIYLVFSTISPRVEAIARLKRAGWHFLVGADASRFSQELLGLDLESVLRTGSIRDEMTTEVSSIMQSMVRSDAFRRVLHKYYAFDA